MKKNILVTVLFAMALSSCATEAEKKVEQKLNQEAPVANTQELRKSATMAIETTPGLTDQQRSQLKSLSEKTRAQMDQYRAESLKAQGLLVKEVLSEKSSNTEISVLKKKIKEIENNRLTLLFKTVDEAKNVLGKKSTPEHQRIIHELFYTPVRETQ